MWLYFWLSINNITAIKLYLHSSYFHAALLTLLWSPRLKQFLICIVSAFHLSGKVDEQNAEIITTHNSAMSGDRPDLCSYSPALPFQGDGDSTEQLSLKVVLSLPKATTL